MHLSAPASTRSEQPKTVWTSFHPVPSRPGRCPVRPRGLYGMRVERMTAELTGCATVEKTLRTFWTSAKGAFET